MNFHFKNFQKNEFIFYILLMLLPTTIFAIETTTVTVSPDSTNQYGAYTIDSGISPFFNIVEAGIDSLVVTFDSSTVLPASINPSYIKVNGVSSGGVTVVGQNVYILSPVLLQSIFTPVSFTIVISAAAKIRNPEKNGTGPIGPARTSCKWRRRKSFLHRRIDQNVD